METRLDLAIERTSVSSGDADDRALASFPSNLIYSEPAVVEDDWHLRDYWRAIRKRSWLVAAISILVTTSVAIYMALKPDRYEAHAQVQVDLENTNTTLGPSKNTSIIVSNPLNDPAYFGTQLQILSGPRLLQRVIKRLDLESNPRFSTTPKRPLQQLKGFMGEAGNNAIASNELPFSNDIPETTSPEEIAEAARLAPFVLALQENLTIAPVKEARLPNKTTRLINVSFEDPSPLVAAKVVNTLVDNYVVYNLEVISGANETTSAFLRNQIVEIQCKIRAAEWRLINYAKTNQILSLDASQNTTVERLIGLNQQLLQAENERKTAESVYRASLEPGAAESLAESNYSQLPGAETTAAAQIGKAQTQLAELRQKRAELLVENTEEWPEVKEIDQQIRVLEEQVRESRDRATSIVKSNLATRYNQALSHERALRTAFNQQKVETLAQNQAAINYRIIQQEIETNKSLLDSLLQRAKQNDISAAGLQNNIHVIDYAVAPTEAVGPRRLLNTTLALALSLVFATGLALLLEYLDDTIQTPDEVQKRLGLPTLSLIPSVRGRLRSELRNTSIEKIGHAEHPELLIHTGNQSSLAEAYRHLRSTMLLSSIEPKPKTLLITSSQANEGKTTITVNMAVSLAQTGAKVLLIDADMHRPCLHKMFGVENVQGLSTILAGDVGQFDVNELIEQDQHIGISLLTAGPVPTNPTELLCKEQMKHLLDSLRPHFNYIIIDSPPIITFTDSVIISSMVDGVLLVVHGNKVSRDLVKCSKEILSRVGARIFGVILNNVNPSPASYFYFRRYKEVT
ncbi:MAG TPA: polysaccharide biosynthesis tyrosine autokinase [Pyrinomonadaceae bacterium]